MRKLAQSLIGVAMMVAGVMTGVSAQGKERIIVVTHGQANDSFWSVVKNGVSQAAKDYGVTVDYEAP
jgi:simple sugar transport system substrate-binding protein